MLLMLLLPRMLLRMLPLRAFCSVALPNEFVFVLEKSNYHVIYSNSTNNYSTIRTEKFKALNTNIIHTNIKYKQTNIIHKGKHTNIIHL